MTRVNLKTITNYIVCFKPNKKIGFLWVIARIVAGHKVITIYYFEER